MPLPNEYETGLIVAGGVVVHNCRCRLVRHRTGKNGTLLRSEHLGGKGLIFAKGSHKNAVVRWFEQGAHDIGIPPRPFLPVTPDGYLQGGAGEETCPLPAGRPCTLAPV